jgi:hypothetical protein
MPWEAAGITRPQREGLTMLAFQSNLHLSDYPKSYNSISYKLSLMVVEVPGVGKGVAGVEFG